MQRKENMSKKMGILQAKIFALREKLAKTDYKAIKHAEGELSDEEYETIRIERREWRAKINELEAELSAEREDA